MSCDLLVHPVCNAWEHSGSTRQHHVSVQVLSDVHITLHDRVEGSVINALSLHAHQAGCEQHLRAPEPLTANGDNLHKTIQLVKLIQRSLVPKTGVPSMHDDVSICLLQQSNTVAQRLTIYDTYSA